MAQPKKRRGHRPIHVDGVDYRWCVKAKRFSNGDGYIILTHDQIKGQKLTIYLKDWFYPYPSIMGDIMLKRQPITSKFICEVIVFARQHDWTPEKPAPDFELVYDETEGFSLSSN